jgi:hypothetical protein
MGTIRIRFILVALAVGFFAIGMSAFLNYFKYKSTFGEIVKDRMLVIGRGVENTIQASLAVGLQFSDLDTLPTLLSREKAADTLIRGIDVFDHTGQILYSTDAGRVKREVPAAWVRAADRSKSTDWISEDGADAIAGISLKNNFDLTVGYLAMRYPRAYLEDAAAGVGREILIAAAAAFLALALVTPLALSVVIRRFERDLAALERAASHLEDGSLPPPETGSAFDASIASLHASLAGARKGLADVRAKLDAAPTG